MHRRTSHDAKHAPAARVQRFVGLIVSQDHTLRNRKFGPAQVRAPSARITTQKNTKKPMVGTGSRSAMAAKPWSLDSDQTPAPKCMRQTSMTTIMRTTKDSIVGRTPK